MRDGIRVGMVGHAICEFVSADSEKQVGRLGGLAVGGMELTRELCTTDSCTMGDI